MSIYSSKFLKQQRIPSCDITNRFFFFFSFQLSLFGVATAHLLSPHPSVNHILLHNTHTLHILPHHIQPPLPWPSPFPSSRHLHLQCPSPYILCFSPFHMSVSRCKKGIPGQVALNDPAQNPHLRNALNDPTLGKRVHSMTPSLKKIFLRHKKN